MSVDERPSHEVEDLGDCIPPSKRRKRNDFSLSDFKSGSIVRVKLRNFMSYSLTEFNLNPNLNMIIGPNGTGKSTFVNALCIGLHGRMENLGKERITLDEFIKQGCDECNIEIEMKSFEQDDTVTVRRCIKRKIGKGFWWINGEEKTQKEVKLLVKKLNIQLDNLCCFLPQDRVAKFATLKPHQLLRELERCYNDGELLKYHEEVIVKNNMKAANKKRLAELNNDLAKLEEKNERLHAEVDKYKAYKQKKEDKKHHMRLIPFVKIEAQRAKSSQLKQLHRAKVAEYAAFTKRVEPIISQLQQQQSGLEEIKQKISGLNDKNGDLEKELQAKFSDISDQSKQVALLNSKRDRLQEKTLQAKKNIVDRQKELSDIEQQISALEEEVSDDDFEVLKQRRSKLHSDQQALREVIDDAETTEKDSRRILQYAENKIQRLKEELNSRDKLTTALNPNDSSHVAIAEIVRYLRNHGDEFRGKVFDPPILSVDIKAEYVTKFEKIVDNNSQVAFTVVDGATFDKFSQVVYSQLNKNVPIRTLLSKDFHITKNRSMSTEQVKGMGFDGYMSDFVSGPPQVLQMLCETSKMNEIPVAVRDIGDKNLKLATTPDEKGRIKFTRLVVANQLHQIHRSAYGKRQVISRASFIPNKVFLFKGQQGVSSERKEEIVRQIGEETQKLESERVKMTKAVDNMKETRDNYQKVQSDFEKVQRRLKRQAEDRKKLDLSYGRKNNLIRSLKDAQEELQELERSESNGENSEYIRICAEIEKINVGKVATLEEIAELIKQVSSNEKRLTELMMQNIERKNRLVTISEFSEDIQQQKRDYEEDLEQRKRRYDELKRQMKLEIVALRVKTEKEYSEEDQNVLRQLTDMYSERGCFTLREIELKIEEIKHEMALLHNHDASSIKTVEQNNELIRELVKERPALVDSIEALGRDLDSLYTKWYPKLKLLVKVIDFRFGESFKKVATHGEIVLNDDDSDFDNWKLEIKVQFREGSQLAILDRFTQSGGEKSVTIATFLNALQGLVSSPFRVVDEINQGMDAKNERMVHKLIVESSCSQTQTLHEALTEEEIEDFGLVEARTQVFLITPKLLNGLYYHENMSIHCIMSGPWTPDPSADKENLKLGLLKDYV